MAYDAPSTEITGALITATDYNKIVNSILASAVAAMTTKGDTVAATAANALARVAVPADYHPLMGLASAAAGITAGPKLTPYNLLTNGGMEIWQRGAGAFTLNNAYGPDRWSSSLNGTTALSVSRDNTNQDAASLYCAALTVTSWNTQSYYVQKLEDFTQFKGKTVTCSVRVKTSTASAIRLTVYDGVTGITYSGYHTGGGAYETLTFTLPVSASATTLQVWLVLNANATVYVDNAMLVLGSVAADYAPLHPAEEMERCQRYYQVIGGTTAYEQAGSGYVYSTTNSVIFLPFLVQMAIAPTVTKSAAGDWCVNAAGGAATALSAMAFDQITVRGCRVLADVAAGLTAGQGVNLFANNTTNARIFLEANP